MSKIFSNQHHRGATNKMDIERFHNELAMRLGYERIVKDKRILISVEESEEPLVTLKIEGSEDFTKVMQFDTASQSKIEIWR